MHCNVHTFEFERVFAEFSKVSEKQKENLKLQTNRKSQVYEAQKFRNTACGVTQGRPLEID